MIFRRALHSGCRYHLLAYRWLTSFPRSQYDLTGSKPNTAAGGPRTREMSTSISSASLTVYSSSSTGTTASNVTETLVDVGHGRASIKHGRTVGETPPDCGD
jgi:hypothetical protein